MSAFSEAWSLLKESAPRSLFDIHDESEKEHGFLAQDFKVDLSGYGSERVKGPGVTTSYPRIRGGSKSSVHPGSLYQHMLASNRWMREPGMEEMMWSKAKKKGGRPFAEKLMAEQATEVSAHEATHQALAQIEPKLDNAGHEYAAYMAEDAQREPRDTHTTMRGIAAHPDSIPSKMDLSQINGIQRILDDLVAGGLSPEEQAFTMGRRARENAVKQLNRGMNNRRLGI